MISGLQYLESKNGIKQFLVQLRTSRSLLKPCNSLQAIIVAYILLKKSFSNSTFNFWEATVSFGSTISLHLNRPLDTFGTEGIWMEGMILVGNITLNYFHLYG